jgi:hypothetical protein
MAMVVPLVQLTTAFPLGFQVPSVLCPDVSRLQLLCSRYGNQAVYVLHLDEAKVALGLSRLFGV